MALADGIYVGLSVFLSPNLALVLSANVIQLSATHVDFDTIVRITRSLNRNRVWEYIMLKNPVLQRLSAVVSVLRIEHGRKHEVSCKAVRIA